MILDGFVVSVGIYLMVELILLCGKLVSPPKNGGFKSDVV